MMTKFYKILYNAEVDLLDGPLKTIEANTDPGMTAKSAVRPPTNRRRSLKGAMRQCV